MKERLINHVSLTRRLRQLLVLLALLLLPAGMWAEDYPITIAGVQVTDANAENITGGNITGTVSFEYDAEYGTSTLNLEGATINGDIVYTSESESSLLIILNGASTVNRITHTGQAEANLNVYRAETNTVTHSLTVAGNGTDAAISGFTSYCISDNDFYDVELGLYWKPTFTGNVITSFLITTNVFGGTGTESSPYIISTPTQLEVFATKYNNEELASDCYVKLGGVINCNGLEEFAPIGTSEIPFSGTFDGVSTDNYIENLTYSAYSADSYNGLFGYIDGGTVQNLKLAGCTFSGGDEVGAIVGHLTSGAINNCQVATSTLSSHNDVQNVSVGGIAGVVENGTISNCTVLATSVTGLTTYSEFSGSSNAGGIAGLIECPEEGTVSISSNTVAKGEGSTPTTILSSHGHSSYACAGGIVGRCTGDGAAGITISGNNVIDNTAVNSIDGNASENLYSGAIVGYKGNAILSATLSDNVYRYTVTTSTKKGEADAVTRDGYEERGTGTENTVVQGSYDLTDNDGAVLYTKKLTIAHDHIVEYGPAEWHKGFSTDGGVFHLIPGLETTVTLKPDDYYTITATTLSYGTTPTVDDLTPVVEDGVYSYTFTMPDNDATLTPTTDLPGYLGLTVAGVPVTETNASNVMGGEEYASVSYSDGTLTLKGANITPSSQDIIIIDEGVEALTVHLVGYNQIGAYGQYAFNLKGNTALTFTTSDKMPGSLVSNGNVFKQQPSVTYQNGLALDANNTEIKAETGTMTVTGLTGAVSYVNSDNNGSAYMYSSPFPFEATKAEMSYGDAVVVSTPDNTTTTELWTSNIQSANVLKYTLQFDWGTCTNKNVMVQVVGYNQQEEEPYGWVADGETYSDAVALSTADNDGIIEIPIKKDITSSELRLRFSSNASFSFVALSVGITQIVNYPVVVAGTQVTSKNASDVLGDKKISYDVETNTLTLNGATVGEDGSNPEPTIPEAPGISYSGTDDLTISLIGSNTIYGMGGCDAIRYSGEPGDNQPKLIFAKGDNQPCSLQLSAIETTVISSGFSQINGVNGINDTYAEALTLIFNKEVSYGSESDGLYYYNEEVSYPVTSAVITSGYGLTVGDVMVHEGNAADILDGDETNDGKVSYNATTNTLKLDGADLSGNGISYEGAEDLTIALKGNSQVFSISYTNNEAEDIPQLLFTKAEGATDCTLALNSKGDGSVIDGFSDIDYGTFNTMSSDPLKYGKMTPEEDYICLLDAITNDFMSELTITTATTYPLWVGGTQVTGTSVTADNIQRCGNYVDNEEYGITFTPGETNTLNLLRSGITIEESRKPAIVSSLDNLTIQLEGINNIIFNGEYSYYMIVSTDANATLTFKAVGDDAMLNANISESAYIGSPANGFKTVSYEDDLVYIANGTSTQTIKRIPAITFAGSNLWATYYSTENLKVPDGLTAYVVSAVNETTGAVTVTSIGYIPADEAILLQREENGAASGYTATAYTSQPTGFTNMLRGSEDDTSIEDGDFEGPVYVLFNDKFKRAISGTIPARRGFLVPGEMVAPGEAPQYLTISITDGNTTAIDTLTVDDNSNDSWYTIDGLKLNGKPQRKGLFINNGKKVYINNNK